MHNDLGSGKRYNESPEAYAKRLSEDLLKNHALIKEHTGQKMNTFTYPLGVIGKGSKEILMSIGYKASLSCTEGLNVIKQDDPDGLFNLKRCIRRSGHSVAEVLGKLGK